MNQIASASTFHSSRAVAAQEAPAPDEQTAAPEPQQIPSDEAPSVGVTAQDIVVISQTKGIGEMVGRAIGLDNSVAVRVDTRPLVEIAADAALDMSGCYVVVFEANPGDATELGALAHLRATCDDATSFLAMTAEAVTLDYARKLMEAGVDEVLPLSAVRPDLRDTVAITDELTVTNAPSGAPAHNGAIIAVSQTRGGIGATTLALNLAHALSAPPRRPRGSEGKRVAVVDLDFQNGTLGARIDVEDNGAYLDLLKRSDAPEPGYFATALERYKDRFDVLAAPVQFAPVDAMNAEKMTLMLVELRLSYDYVILDLPRTLVDWISPILERADRMLIVTDTGVASIRQARRLIDFYTEEHVSLPVDVIVSKEKKPFSMPEAMKEAAKFLERPIEHWIPRDDAKAKKAIDLGQPMLEAARRSAVAKPMAKLVASLASIHETARRREA